MANDFIPTRDAELDTWLLNFKTLIAANPANYGLVAGDATNSNPSIVSPMVPNGWNPDPLQGEPPLPSTLPLRSYGSMHPPSRPTQPPTITGGANDPVHGYGRETIGTRISRIIPSHGVSLIDDADCLRRVRADTAAVLKVENV